MASSTVNQAGKAAPPERAKAYWFVVDTIDDEMGLLYALATTLCQRLEPEDPLNPAASARLTEWRLAQVLEERLERVWLSDLVRDTLLGNNAVREVQHG